MRIFTLLLMLWTVALSAAEPVPLAERSFWVIRGTESPDGKLALGWGRLTDRAGEGESRRIKDPAQPAEAPEEADVRNYVVDLRREVILAETEAKHTSAEPVDNQKACAAYWSPESRTVLQVTTFKDRYSGAWLLRVARDGSSISPPFDWQAWTEERATEFLKRRKNRAFGQHEEFAIQILRPLVTESEVEATVWGEVVGKPGRDWCWAVRVKAGMTWNEHGEWRAKAPSVRYLHEGDHEERVLSQQSPDGRYAMQTVQEAGHELWSSLFIHRIELVALPEKRVVAQLLPAAEIGTNFSAPRLVWSADSEWCAFHFQYSGRGGYPSGETVAFRKTDGKFVTASAPRQLRAEVLREKVEGRLSEDVAPVRWLEPGRLLLKQTWQLIWETDEPAELAWEFEAAYDPKKRTLRAGPARELSREAAESRDAEMRAAEVSKP